jgi:hypothetical protein
MRKICHIRCNNNYWQKLDLSNLSPRWEKNKNQFSYYTQILNLWDKNLKIKHLPFRKQIRDLILDRISNIGYFDIILESNQHCEEYFNKHTSSDILFYQQDDDDIFLCLPKLDELSDGINIFNYSFIDPVGGRRKKGYKTRVFGFDKPTRTIQSNHSLIYNKNNYIDIINHKLYKAGHTYYDKLAQMYKSTIFDYPISIQFYHLHSISLWKHHFRKCKRNYTEKGIFIDYVSNYIKELDLLCNTNNKDIPLINDINNLYKQLL